MHFTLYIPTQVVFGQPVHDSIAAWLAAAATPRVLLVSDPLLIELPWAQQISAALEASGGKVILYTHVSSNPDVREVHQGLELAREERVDALVALGGGSVIDVAKAIAMLLTNGGSYTDYLNGNRRVRRRSAFLVAIPTTAGTGSEVTRSCSILDGTSATYKSVASPWMFPHVAWIDPALTLSLPPPLTAATGITVMIQALEAYLARRANPFVDPLAIAAIQTVWQHLPRAMTDGQDITARRAMLLAALWAGWCHDQCGGGLVEAISVPLRLHLHLHNGIAGALALPRVLRFNLPAIPSAKRQQISTALGLAPDVPDEQLVERLAQFIQYLGLPRCLKDLDTAVIDYGWHRFADEVMQQTESITNNPRAVSVEDCRVLLAAILSG
ncbi:MAG: iron-containing alcohol dehydrogenase [Anaerolineae bacterium]|nr:iron-containing alcohol dehydrogenase [Anaerolineae bacterium]